MSSRFAWSVSAILGLAAFAVSVWYPGWWLLHNRAMDLPSYYVAGLLVVNGRNPYHPVELGTTAQRLGLADPIYPYIYFPIIALIFMPLSLMRYGSVQLLWFAVSQVFFWLSIVLLFQITRRCYPSESISSFRRLLYLVPVTCLAYPLVVNYQHGQVNTMMFFLICAFLYMLMSGSPVTAGIALALVIMIKPQPAVILPYLVFRKHIRCAVSTLVSFTAGTILTAHVVGWANFGYYLSDVLPSFSMIETRFPPIPLYVPANQSIHGIVSRLFQTTGYTVGILDYPDLVAPVSTFLIISVLVIGFGRVYTWNRGLGVSDRIILRDCAFLLVMSILLSPITWDHHLVTAFVAAIFLLFEKPGEFWKSSPGLVLGVCWILMIIPLYPFHPVWAINGIAALGTSIKAFALIGFWGLFAGSV